MKKIFIVFMFFLLLIGVCFGCYKMFFTFEKQDDYIKQDNYVEKENKYVFFEDGRTIKKTSLYVNNGNDFVIIGEIEKNISLKFKELINNYLLIDGFDEKYYINIEDIEECEECVLDKDKRYLEYILFNENVVTGDKTSFYDSENNLLYSLNFSYNLPIIIKEDNRYGVEFNDELVYINSYDIKSVEKTFNTDEKNSTGVGVLNYHFFYDETNAKEKNECNQSICESTKQFQSELDYIKENNILTITTKELELYIDGKINLPKSVLITIDDGWMMGHALDLLEKNKMYGCVFLITSWWDKIDFIDDYEYIEFNSHGEKLHDAGICPGGQGGAIKCLPKDKLLNDLKVSSEKLNGSKVIAYPFYEYNNYSIETLKEAGYTMAFAGESSYSDNLVHVGSNKYKLPRFIMVNYTTLRDLDNYFSKIN